MSVPRKLNQGEFLTSIPASSWNAFYDTWDRVKRMPGLGTSSAKTSASSRLVIPVFNDSGAAITADFPILKLDTPVVTTDDSDRAQFDALAMYGVTPDDDTTPSQIAVLQGPVADGRSAGGVIVGPTWVQVEWTDESHTHALPKADDDTQLTSAANGIPILWHEEIPGSLPGTIWALVLLGSPMKGNISGFLNDALSQGSSASMSVCDYDSDDNFIDTGVDVDVWDNKLNVGDEDIAANTRIDAWWSYDSGRYMLGNAHCEVEDEENLPFLASSPDGGDASMVGTGVIDGGSASASGGTLYDGGFA